MLVSRIIRSSLKAIGVIDPFNSVDSTYALDGLESLNMMLKTWGTRGIIVHHVVSENFPFVQGQSSYTIGTAGNFNTVRPNRVVGGYIRDTNGNDTPLKIIDRDKYNAYTAKTVEGGPETVYYQPTYPLGTLYFLYTPNQAYTLHLDSLKPLAAITDINADLNLPPEYEEAIKWNLALRLAPDYSVPVRPDVVSLAEDTYKSLSIQPVPEASFAGFPGIGPNRGTETILLG